MRAFQIRFVYQLFFKLWLANKNSTVPHYVAFPSQSVDRLTVFSSILIHLFLYYTYTFFDCSFHLLSNSLI